MSEPRAVLVRGKRNWRRLWLRRHRSTVSVPVVDISGYVKRLEEQTCPHEWVTDWTNGANGAWFCHKCGVPGWTEPVA